MAFNFPNTPTEGMLFTDAASGAQYAYTNGVWMQSSAAQIKLATGRNRVVNPAFQISQENGTNFITASGSFPADQWQLFSVSTGTAGWQIQAGTGTEVLNWLRFNATVADTSIAAGEYHGLFQIIEGLRASEFKWGTATAVPAVLRFKARGSIVGTFSAHLRNSPVTRSYVKACTLSAANVWQEFILPIPADTAGTWASDNTAGLSIGFMSMCGATLTAPAEGWNGGNFFAAPGGSNWMSATGQLLDIANVGLYLDAQSTGAAPPWEAPDFAQELAACQRYYQLFGRSNGARLGLGQAYAATIADILIPLSPPMRVGPAFTYSSALQLITPGGGSVAPSALAIGATRAWMGVITCTLPAGSGMSSGLATQLTTTDANGCVTFSARM